VNNFNLKDTIFIIKKHIKGVITFFIMINLMAILSFGLVFNNHITYIDTQMNNNIIEYGEIDKEQLCNIAECIRVADLGLKKCYKPDKKGHLRVTDFRNNSYTNIIGALNITDTYHLTIFNKKANAHFAINTDSILADYYLLMFLFIPLSLIIYILPLISSIKEEKEESILINAGSEALLANKSMINITENIHHELNTPLEVIDNKIEKIHGELSNFLLEEYEATENIKNLPEDRVQRNKRLVKLNEDFEFIKTSSEQIYAVLEKMKGFKHLRYSNGNKSIKNIIDGGFKIINISNTNFEYKVDKQFSKFKIGSEKLKNADFLSIILNHIKNSLEANASMIYILLAKSDDKDIYIRIIDNGNGIKQEAQKKIFEPNFSTKNSDSGIRGNGMYLNKHIIKNAGGDIKLISSSNKGTTIELKIPIIKK
jgi:signal transduction histidine kinase